MKRVWNFLFAEPLHWIFLAFFQPRRLERELGPIRLLQRFYLLLRTSLPTLLFGYPILVGVRLLLIDLHVSPSVGITSFFLKAFGYSVVGVVVGIAWGVVLGGLRAEAALVVGGGLLGLVVIVVVGLIGLVGLVGAVLAVVGAVLGLELGVSLLVEVGASVLVVGGVLGVGVLLVGGVLGVGVGASNGILIGVVNSIVFISVYLVCFFRLPFYLVSGTSALGVYFASRKSRTQVFTFLHHSSLYWDELVYLRLPYLKKTLLLAYEQDAEQALKEIAFISAERPLQLWAARSALLEIVVRDLAQCTTLTEVAKALNLLDTLFPQETKLLSPQWSVPLTNLREASQDALRFIGPVGRRAKLEALQDMVNHLKRARLNSSLGNAQLSGQFSHVISLWLAIAENEHIRLQQLPEYVGRIYNPYNPGNALKPDDPLFFGRQDLVLLLEEELAKGDRRPTFLMTGERRMGKSSTLLQLPRLLGSRFFPVFYDLQSPGILTSTSIFLSSVAGGIEKVMRAHGIFVRRLEYLTVRDYGKQSFLAETFASSNSVSLYDESSSSVFYLFEQWLRTVEDVLEKEDRTLLLLLDEFEKLDSAEQKRNFDLPLLLDWFRNLIQYHPRVALLFSGVRTFSELGKERNLNWSGYFVNVQTLHVSFLHIDEARRLISSPIAEFLGDEIYGDGVVEAIIEETGCHPFLVQAVCSALIDLLNVQKKPRAELSDLESAVERTLSNWWDTYFRDLWVRTDETQRLCLLALLEFTPATVEQIQQASALEHKQVRRTLQILLSRDLVSEPESGLYRISTPLFRRWVERFAEL